MELKILNRVPSGGQRLTTIKINIICTVLVSFASRGGTCHGLIFRGREGTEDLRTYIEFAKAQG